MPRRLTCHVHVIEDPDGHAPRLRLRGECILVAVSDGEHVGLGEASHSGDDRACARYVRELFDAHLRDRPAASLPSCGAHGAASLAAAGGDLVAATAISALDQAIVELTARREGVPVWKLFAGTAVRDRLPLYATINRALSDRSAADHVAVASAALERGFTEIKCAPFDAVTPGGDQVAAAAEGIAVLERLRAALPRTGIRVDLHERFTPEAFLAVSERIEAIDPRWIEEPCPLRDHGGRLAGIRRCLRCSLAAGELLWGRDGFRPIVRGGLADVILPDVKHCGGFGELLRICALASTHGVEVSPHNPSGAVSTLASAHAAAVLPAVTSLEVAFRRAPGPLEGGLVRNGAIEIPQAPGWGVESRSILAGSRRLEP